MKRYIFILMGILLPLFSPAQNTKKANQTADLDKAQTDRIADFGKVWGVINYFHPVSGKGILNTDSLVIHNIGALFKNANSTNFRQALNGMFADVGDHQSGIITSIENDNLTPNRTERNVPNILTLQSNALYLNIPQKVFQSNAKPDSLLKAALSDHQLFVVDLRNSAINHQLGLKQYSDFVQPLVASLIRNTLILPVSRGFYYHGLIREDFPHDINILPQDKNGAITDKLQVYFGIRNISEGAYVQAHSQTIYSHKRFCFIVNKYVNINTFKALLALRHRNLCNLIVDGDMPDYVYGDFYKMELSDGVIVKIRTSEALYEDGTLGAGPDLTLPLQNDTSLNSICIKQALKLLNQPIIKQAIKASENTVYIRKSQNDYPTAGVTDTRFRLLGLFNFWNAVHYFSPNKNLISQNWDNALAYYIPEFVGANNEKSYFLALLKLTASIRDGHSILISKRGGRTPIGIMDGNLPIIANLIDKKVFITNVLADTSQKAALSLLHEGDELLSIDNVPVTQLAKQWEPYIVASNKAGFDREYYFTWLTNGDVNSNALLTIRDNGEIKKVSLKRIKRDDYYGLTGAANRVPTVPPYCKVLNGNIGYLRINRVFSTELDSLSNILKNCPTIILDARGYPRDSQIGENLATYIATKTDTVAYDRFPFVVSPDLSKNYTIVESEVVSPNKNPNLKNKKYFILADEGNQSHGEGNLIGLQGVTKATTVGTQTAGANGMAITINFPGQYFSFFSGFGEYYPDGTPNQKLGVKIDIPVIKTLLGNLQGKDEILDKAIELAKEQ